MGAQGARDFCDFFPGPREGPTGPMILTFTGTGHNMDQHGTKNQRRRTASVKKSPVCPPVCRKLKWASPNSDSGQESDEVQRAAAELLRSEKKLMKTALESGLFVWNIYILGQNAVYIDSY
jgi:hypothetical protein